MNNARKPEPSPKTIKGAKSDWEMVLGLEVHAQVASNAKLFSAASTEFGAEPNSNVDFVDAAMPGMLPVINEFCVEQAIKTGLALNAEVNRFSAFDRKNYFYPDLPQGYQISQFYHPVVGGGEVSVNMGGGTERRVRIDHIHLEQDAGKSLHDMDPDLSLVDLNRTGVALMEIVSLPDMRGPDEAAAFVLKLRQIMRYVGSCDGNMQNGNLRADVNISVRPIGSREYGTRCEIKNMNSTRFIQQAIEYEARRQVAILEDGGLVQQETRLFDTVSGKTRSMRSKEESHDYRYFPCPDLLPLNISEDWISAVGNELPELPDCKVKRFVRDYGITEYDADVLAAERENADFFEKVAQGRNGKQAANWIINELFGRLNKENLSIATTPVSASQLGAILDMLESGEISGKIAKTVFDIVWTEGGDPSVVVEQRGLRQVTDIAAIESVVDQIFSEHPEQVEKARQNPRVAGFFVGQVMKATGGKANPKTVNELISRKLSH
ncbi:MAG: Asp-tRNA(Asn)/Glu-tRNA(Gln) amidotransferase subunit GatB [Rhodobacteraceae bacterium]|nr:Asp-tRNA(Asn)/Glu-tRNA(Gln) amidotransferase subunit GatB [Paracoccaceae bacterium]